MRGYKDWDLLFDIKERFEDWYKEWSYLLFDPTLFLGDEFNSVHFDWRAAYEKGRLDDHFRIVLIEVNATSYATNSQAVRMFYQELHEYDTSWIVERAFFPATKEDAAIIKESGLPPVASESHMPVSCFDVLCFSQQMIGDEINLVGMLVDSGIPVLSSDRTEQDPFIIRGGASSFNPSVIMDVCDIFFVGEGEDILPELMSLIRREREDGKSREEILLKAVRTWDCLWAPCFYEQRFDHQGKLIGMFAKREDVPKKIRYAYVKDMDQSFIMTKPLGVYNTPSIIGSGLEITRGCEGQCGFCVSGFTYLPFRARSADKVITVIRDRVYHSGSPATTLSSFCGTSYPWLNSLIRKIYIDEEGILSGLSKRVKTMSLRLDTVHENKEFASFLVRQSEGRIVFGVEGISQRLRQMVSKNYTEDQILETFRMLCQNGYTVIKFMFIAGLPGEKEEDWDELINMTEKMLEICACEGRTGENQPHIIYSWTPLKIYAFVPFQWMPARTITKLVPETARARLEELGVHIGFEDLEGEASEYRLVHLLIRGDRRIQDMLLEMAEQGFRHHGIYTKEDEDFVRSWLLKHDLPSVEDWMGSKASDTVFPWDFIDNGVDKEYLWRRYQEACKEVPKDSPRCLTRCSGCGACSPEGQKQMAGYRKRKKEDNKISLTDLSDVIREEEAKKEMFHYAILEFTYDDQYSVVQSYYWECELSRAMNYAGIVHDRDVLKIWKPYREHYDWAVGMNSAVAAFARKLADNELISRINEHTVHMRVTGIRWINGPARVQFLRYQIACPEGTDEDKLRDKITQVLQQETWNVCLPIYRNGKIRRKEADIRRQVLDLSLKDHQITMKLRLNLSPYHVYQELLGVPWETAGKYRMVRTEMAYEL